MGVSRYYKPQVQQYQSQFVPLPLEFLDKKIQEKQQTADKARELQDKLLFDIGSTPAVEEHKDIRDAKLTEYSKEIESITNKYKDDPALALNDVYNLYKKYQTDATTGDLATIRSTYEVDKKAQEKLADMDPAERQHYINAFGYGANRSKFSQQRGRSIDGKPVGLNYGEGWYKALDTDAHLEKRFGDLKGSETAKFHEWADAFDKKLGAGMKVKTGGVDYKDIYAEAFRIAQDPGDDRLLQQKGYDITNKNNAERLAKSLASNVYGLTEKQFDDKVKSGEFTEGTINNMALVESIANSGKRFRYSKYEETPISTFQGREAQQKAIDSQKTIIGTQSKLPGSSVDVADIPTEKGPLGDWTNWVSGLIPTVAVTLQGLKGLGKVMFDDKAGIKEAKDKLESGRIDVSKMENAPGTFTDDSKYDSVDRFKAHTKNLAIDAAKGLLTLQEKISFAEDDKITEITVDNSDPKYTNMMQNIVASNPQLRNLKNSIETLKKTGGNTKQYEDTYKKLLTEEAIKTVNNKLDVPFYPQYRQLTPSEFKTLNTHLVGPNGNLLGGTINSKWVDLDTGEPISGKDVFEKYSKAQINYAVDKDIPYRTLNPLAQITVSDDKGNEKILLATIPTEPEKGYEAYNALTQSNFSTSGMSEKITMPRSIELGDKIYSINSSENRLAIAGQEIQTQKIGNTIFTIINPTGKTTIDPQTGFSILEGEAVGIGNNLDMSIALANNAFVKNRTTK